MTSYKCVATETFEKKNAILERLTYRIYSVLEGLDHKVADISDLLSVGRARP